MPRLIETPEGITQWCDECQARTLLGYPNVEATEDDSPEWRPFNSETDDTSFCIVCHTVQGSHHQTQKREEKD